MKKFEQFTGDVNPFEYGGAWFDGEEIVYTPGLEHVDSNYVFVFRFDGDRDPANEKWIELNKVASLVGLSLDEFRKKSFQDQWIDVGYYYGFYELDSFPCKYNKQELLNYLEIEKF